MPRGVCGGREEERGFRRHLGGISLRGLVTLVSLTLNLVTLSRSLFLYYKPAAVGGGGGGEGFLLGEEGRGVMGEAAPAAETSPFIVGGGGCYSQTGNGGGVCLVVEKPPREHATNNNDNNNRACPGGAGGGPAEQQIAAACSSTRSTRTPSSDSVINLDHGDPTMFESFWRTMGDESSIVISGWQTMSYFSDVGNICWFLEPHFAEQISRLHRLVGNARTHDRHIIVGTGSTQLFQAALYALSPLDASEPISVVSATPYYSSYPAVTDYLRSGLYRWAGDAHAFQGDAPYIELVCSPNNPDGFSKQAVLNSDNGKTIHDLAYYWPQYTAITSAADHDIMLFTISKSTGHAGTRIGWALVKDKDVAKKMTKFIELNTIGVSKDSQLRAAKIIKAVSDGYELQNPNVAKRFFDYGRSLMAERWERLREVIRITGIFTLPEFALEFCSFTGERMKPHPAFAWLKCEREDLEDCEGFLRGHKLLTRSGKHFGVEPRYVRVSMLDRDDIFDLFIERLFSIR